MTVGGGVRHTASARPRKHPHHPLHAPTWRASASALAPTWPRPEELGGGMPLLTASAACWRRNFAILWRAVRVCTAVCGCKGCMEVRRQAGPSHAGGHEPPQPSPLGHQAPRPARAHLRGVQPLLVALDDGGVDGAAVPHHLHHLCGTHTHVRYGRYLRTLWHGAEPVRQSGCVTCSAPPALLSARAAVPYALIAIYITRSTREKAPTHPRFAARGRVAPPCR